MWSEYHPGRRWRAFLAGSIAVVLAPLLLVSGAGAGKPDAAATPFETDVTYSGMLRSGEPEIAIDPQDPDHLAVTAFEAVNTYTKPLTFKERALGTNTSWCQLQFSDDGGNGWSNALITPHAYTEPPSSPYEPGKVHTNTTDCIIGWAPNGRIYVGSATFVPVEVPSGGFQGVLFPLGGVTVTSTIDEGRTFSLSLPISSEDLPGLLARGLTPSTNGFANPYDRPWLRVDQSNGDVYVAASGHPQYYVTVSHDEGMTWGRLEALDCDEATPPGAHEVCGAYPAIAGAYIDAAKGVLSAAYISSGAGCPCGIFETSDDAGAHWQRHVVASGLPSGSSIQVAASQNDARRFAVFVLPPARTALQVYATRDGGKTWSAPVSLGDMTEAHRINRPWIAFSPGNRLGVFWRTAYPPFQPSGLQSGTQDVFVALSKDGGRTFEGTVKINAEPSPPPDPTQIVQDDDSYVVLSDKAIYAVWGDWRPTIGNPRGDLNTWFGRVPFKHFGDDGS